jgi:hypothetical protein
LWRLLGQNPFTVGATEEPRVLICIAGSGQITHEEIPYSVGKGDVWVNAAAAKEAVVHHGLNKQRNGND